VGAEAKLYKKLKESTPKIIWNRIENLSVPGMPDLLGYNANGHFFTVELKVTKGKKIRFSPHQIAWHITHPNNTFILVQALGPRAVNRYQLFRGSRIMELVACGLELEACRLGLDACRSELEALA
jgi:hypothetical protein